eukprot:CAMPEP_0185769062 /NCGR_PEP_ID=MMETSP1174-20130828/53346_1 /TAXON_ID=35687 /ORGANISM="Dictyocha speculum, Strain CCMP1381" /LENGTH=556 /DNA_ID=CAMNT_0028454013 /DNA_START=125 /DNA_END=1792 /DNA_ORIENTATION=+
MHLRKIVSQQTARLASVAIEDALPTRFDELAIDAATKRALRDPVRGFGYVEMTPVQAAAIGPALQGLDVLAKARTGTGKTLGFLVPSVQRILESPTQPVLRQAEIGVLILSPTRELAQQTAREAKTILAFHGNDYEGDYGVQCVVGGTPVGREANRLRKCPPAILVATPGRLLDHLQQDDRTGVKKACRNLRVLVFDEADRLLDQGFKKAIDSIVAMLSASSKTRQTMLFSATFPDSVTQIASNALRQSPPPVFVDVGAGIGEVDDGEEPTMRIPQRVLVTPLDDQLEQVMAMCMAQREAGDANKVIVFLPTARQTQLYAMAFQEVCAVRDTEQRSSFACETYELHSRKSQSKRDRTSKAFRGATSGILFASDVAARGLDYPDVTLVVQVGAPSERAQYTHRLGRTARGGKKGEGVLFLADFEEPLLAGKLLEGLPLQQTALLSMGHDNDGSNNNLVPAIDVSAYLPAALNQVHSGDDSIGSQMYAAWLGYHISFIKRCRISKEDLVDMANSLAVNSLQLPTQPGISAKAAGCMGLKGQPGIRIEKKFGGGGGGGG